MPKVKQDKHGLYIFSGDHTWRPIQSKETAWICEEYAKSRGSVPQSKFSIGQEVSITGNYDLTSYVYIRGHKRETEELWFSHSYEPNDKGNKIPSFTP